MSDHGSNVLAGGDRRARGEFAIEFSQKSVTELIKHHKWQLRRRNLSGEGEAGD
jgi:hypothetical protein